MLERHTDCSSGSAASSIMKHADQTATFSHKPINSERVSAETKSSPHLSCYNKQRGSMETMLYLFLFHRPLHIYNFLFCFFELNHISTCSLIRCLSAGLVVQQSVDVCVLCYTRGENHLQTSFSDLRSQGGDMHTVYGDIAWLQIKTQAGNIGVMQLW